MSLRLFWGYKVETSYVFQISKVRDIEVVIAFQNLVIQYKDLQWRRYWLRKKLFQELWQILWLEETGPDYRDMWCIAVYVMKQKLLENWKSSDCWKS